ncbi:hypothetical protein ACFQ60_36740 [Streptomyces zhihengii]
MVPPSRPAWNAFTRATPMITPATTAGVVARTGTRAVTNRPSGSSILMSVRAPGFVRKEVSFIWFSLSVFRFGWGRRSLDDGLLLADRVAERHTDRDAGGEGSRDDHGRGRDGDRAHGGVTGVLLGQGLAVAGTAWKTAACMDFLLGV